jgi:hypothetical protein
LPAVGEERDEDRLGEVLDLLREIAARCCAAAAAEGPRDAELNDRGERVDELSDGRTFPRDRPSY